MRKIIAIIFALLCVLPFVSAGAIYVKDGNVGIGASNPDFTLTVYKDLGLGTGEHTLVDIGRNTGGHRLLMGYYAEGGAITGSFIRSGGSNGNGNIAIGTYSTPKAMVIKDNGNVVIQSVNGEALLTIDALSDNRNAAIFLGEQGVNTYGFKLFYDSNNFKINRYNNDAGTNVLTIDRGNGHVGIGTANPTQKLEVNGNVKITNLAGSGNSCVCTDSTGVLYRCPC